jgi:hypothetical protein
MIDIIIITLVISASLVLAIGLGYWYGYNEARAEEFIRLDEHQQRKIDKVSGLLNKV